MMMTKKMMRENKVFCVYEIFLSSQTFGDDMVTTRRMFAIGLACMIGTFIASKLKAKGTSDTNGYKKCQYTDREKGLSIMIYHMDII